MGQGHGWEGSVLELLRGKDFEFTVTGAEDITPRYRRLRLTDRGMLAGRERLGAGGEARGHHRGHGPRHHEATAPRGNGTTRQRHHEATVHGTTRQRVNAMGYWRTEA
jgi:NADPH-dependent ferric siderophore reductase